MAACQFFQSKPNSSPATDSCNCDFCQDLSSQALHKPKSLLCRHHFIPAEYSSQNTHFPSPFSRGLNFLQKSRYDGLPNSQIYRENVPSVVCIITDKRQYTRDLDASKELEYNIGTGVVWDLDGHIVTNYHVIYNAREIRVTFNDETTYEAKLFDSKPDMDVAVLYVDAPKEKLRPIPVDVSVGFDIGDDVLAIGNPFGCIFSISDGIISGCRSEIQYPVTRHIRDVIRIDAHMDPFNSGRPLLDSSNSFIWARIENAIQTNAAINPGNSGGPLFDSFGRIIGINSAIYAPTGVSCGIGFSIPIKTVDGIVNQLLKHGTLDLGTKFASISLWN